MPDEKRCPLCVAELSSPIGPPSNRDGYWVECKHCGPFGLTRESWMVLGQTDADMKTIVSAFCRARQIRKLTPPMLVSDPAAEAKARKGEFVIALGRIMAEHPLPQVGQRLDRAVENLALLSKHPGDRVALTIKDAVVLCCENAAAAIFLLQQLHLKHLLVENTDQLPAAVSLTVDGWNRFAELQQGHDSAVPTQAFVAMWFEPGLEDAYQKGLRPAIEEAGYVPVRIDLKEFNNQITDEIVAEIRRSRFLVADFTGHRQGVYYETGLMHGLGRQVIFTCRKDCIDQAHFDTRQYNHIVWETPEDLRMKLLQRIRATIVR